MNAHDSLDREQAEKLMNYIKNSKATGIYTTHREEETAFANRVILAKKL